MADNFDLVVIGSGPGGYVCAIKAAQLGLKTAIVEKNATFGGTCLNVGCIPSKALLHASEMFHEAGHGLASLGVNVSAPKLDMETMMSHKDKVVKANVDGVAFLLKKNKVTTFHAVGSIKKAGEVVVTNDKGERRSIATRNIVIATGSDIAGIPGVDIRIDEKVIVSSTGALQFSGPPKSMIVVGGGVIGLELGSVWNRLGTKVTVVEYLDKIAGSADVDISRQFLNILKKQGIGFHLSSRVTEIKRKSRGGARVVFQPVQGGSETGLDVDVVLVSTGRRPYHEGLGPEGPGIEMDGDKIKTDDRYQTSIAGIYAIGDVIDGPMLAHRAEDEGIAVAELLAGQAGHVNYKVIPNVIYTMPEVASVGKTEQELKTAGIEYKSGKFPFMANGRARAMNQTEGFVKFLADKKTDRILGAHIIGFGAGEMIHEVAVLMEFGGSSEDLGRICHAHPTLSEVVREAALATFSKPIHM